MIAKDLPSNIINGLIIGDEETYILLYREYYVALCSYSRRYVGRKDIAEEIVSDTFMKIWENRETIQINTSVKAYLFHAVCNNSLNYLRKLRKEEILDEYFLETSSEKIATNCSGDNKIQAYCFRLCMSSNPDNLVPFPKPANYNPTNYELLGRVFDAGWREWFNKFDLIPNRKTDTNNHGPFSSDFIGMNYDYPEATYERRKEIIKEHEDYQKGLLYYVANDPRVPKEIHDEMQKWGLAKDEFPDNGNWSRQLYIREARRMVGVYVTSENDVLAKREVPEPVGMGSYAMDSHNVQRYITSEGFVQDEGDIGVSPDAPYSISYGSIVPKKEECTNLLVPVCVSSSHIAYGSIRMEPVFMILGQSAAIAAVLAIDNKVGVQQVDYALLKEKLLKAGQVIEKSPSVMPK